MYFIQQILNNKNSSFVISKELTTAKQTNGPTLYSGHYWLCTKMLHRKNIYGYTLHFIEAYEGMWVYYCVKADVYVCDTYFACVQIQKTIHFLINLGSLLILIMTMMLYKVI